MPLLGTEFDSRSALSSGPSVTYSTEEEREDLSGPWTCRAPTAGRARSAVACSREPGETGHARRPAAGERAVLNGVGATVPAPHHVTNGSFGLINRGSEINRTWRPDAIFLVGLARIELATSALSVLRSNRLSYSPRGGLRLHHANVGPTRRGLPRPARGGPRMTGWPWPGAHPLGTTGRPRPGRIHRSGHGCGCHRAPIRWA
jgi:hypothetical protein